MPVPRVLEYMANPPKHVNPTDRAFQPMPAGPWPPQNYVYKSQGLPKYSLHPMPHGMVGIQIWDDRFRLIKPDDPRGAFRTPESRLMPNFGIPPAWNQQSALPAGGTNSRGDVRGHSAGPRASSRHQQHQSGQTKAKAQTYELGDECNQWDPSCGLQTTCKDQKEMPMATKRMMKKSGICVRGFDWIRQTFDGWRCEGGQHFVLDNQEAADRFIREWLPKMMKDIKRKQIRGR